MRVQCYKNLHNGKFSIMSLEPGTYGKVIDHADEVFIRNPQFVVQPAGRKRVIKEGRKNVHAFVRGDLTNPTNDIMERVSYNPYRKGAFVDAKGKSVYTGSMARLDASGAYYC